ncbi:hypothetical protein [Roseimicrobium sp. ORNL1]|uniref:hypothetical protein n=1 Tax=Roseimicrobium sp. ORNL1 TaxID=2711231 RepID=UPI0013E1AD46|nr:hypothetical protein [Roseimicrobium sp. ORNL1]QIF04333.1 hypothetical protein G5S37_23345 [Roseimicrobium sp. ORNL1]
MSTHRSERDVRTGQFLEAGQLIGALLLVHLVSYLMARHAFGLVTTGYISWTCVLLPLGALGSVIVLKVNRAWHWGQVILVMLAALFFSFIQLFIFGEASAAV